MLDEVACSFLVLHLAAGGKTATATAMSAIGGMQALHEHGLRVGVEKISVCAINDETCSPSFIASLARL